jgi:hypothetical protein
MHVYDRFKALSELMELHEGPAAPHCLHYCKMVQTGPFNLFDYGRGFLEISVRSMPIGGKEDQRGKYQVRIYIMTVDDGGWGAWSTTTTLDKANATVKKVRDLIEGMVVLPTEEKLNEMLIPLGLYGVNEG